MRYPDLAPYERAQLRVEASWWSILLMPIVVPSVVVVALVVSEHPILVAGVVVGVLLPRMVRVARRAVRQLSAALDSALNGVLPESITRQHALRK